MSENEKINFFDWARLSNEERKGYIRNSVEKILNGHEGETTGYILMVFETKDDKVNADADSTGMINSNLILEYLGVLGIINIERPDNSEGIEEKKDFRYDKFL